MRKDVVHCMGLLKKIFSVVKSHAFEIDSLEEDPITGQLFLWVKVEGKCIPPIKKDPLELLKEGRSSNAFSKEDYDWIIDAVLENQKRLSENKYKKKFTLIKHQFSEQLEEPFIVYSDVNRQIHIKPAKEIHSNVEDLKKFSSDDSACIGYIVGCYVTEKEFQYHREKKPNNIINFK